MLQPRLISIMQRELKSRNLELSPYCVQQIEQLIGQGVQRMRVNNAIDHAGHVMQAERNLRALIKYFSDYSRNRGTFPNLSQADFDAALLSCPTIWPYCSSA
jgi:hypothetical protein